MGDNEYRAIVERLFGYRADGTPVYYIEISGDSTVTRPTKWRGGDICDGSLANESDSGKVFNWNEKSGEWKLKVDFQA